MSSLLDAAGQWDEDKARLAAVTVSRALDEAVALLKAEPVGGEFQVSVDTPLGKVVCGGTGRNTYGEEAFLIIDVGGDDVYRCRTGFGSVMVGRPVSVSIDLGGNDQYVGRGSFSHGSGVFGIGVLVDESGDDVYAAGHVSQGAGVIGWGLLVDGGGNDVFEAGNLGQGAGLFGWGVVWQQGGDTRYAVRHMGQVGLSLMVLNSYAGITLPRGFVNAMTGPTLARLSKKRIAYLVQIVKTNTYGILLHLYKHAIY